MTEKNGFMPELLAPAGDMEKLETAILYGADAVYLGGDSLNLRAGAGGFSAPGLVRGVELARAAGVKVYFTLNVYPRESMLSKVQEYIEVLGELKPDAVIAADPGVVRMVRRELPDIPVHISTQANTSNSESIRFWRECGASRVNVARELRSQELMEMLAIARTQMPDMDLEVFVHGAMCMAVSGRCYMSAFLNDRPGNLGQCSHPCRYEYRPTSVTFEERTRPGQGLWELRDYTPESDGDEFLFEESEEFAFEPLENGQQGQSMADPALTMGHKSGGWTKIFAAQDLCLMHYLEWFSRMKVASVKLEGRTKSSAYLAQVVDAYKTALTDIPKGEFRPEKYLSEVINAASRPLTTGFFDPDRCGAIAMPPDEGEKRPVLGRVLSRLEESKWLIQTKARWKTDEDIELLIPGLIRPRISPEDYGVENSLGQGIEISHPGQQAQFMCDYPEIKPGMFIRKPWDMDDLD
ncbi:peptidase U32 family protein [Pseudodesulfovibrio piezophilus]|uniref:Peptidase U32 n=1 Tax=Pseudodesulfovibrio piezophilus (strain DSM 21447 / JCM 15486 / C1TLV30) TaxID=1322246 RepID=M1WTL4_PSEP2|nr:peptidase U32 family protein [Pseudodesulfovibrio piezophilus]CCH49707.1 Peptidase U32 [Pseudodesulfovibrio piezophilus C1TLV30]